MNREILLNALAARFAPRPDFERDPAQWLQYKLGEFSWSKQREILQSVVENRYTAVHSCHDAGKSYIASRIMSHWIDTADPGQAFVVSTAPSAAQVSAVLWREVAKAFIKAENNGHQLPGRVNRAGYPQWYVNGLLVGYGRKPADYSDSAFQGIHDFKVLVVLDEAGGIPPNIWDGADALTTNEHVRILAIGNPDRPGTRFHQICTPGSRWNHGWNVIRIDALQSPNMNLRYIRQQVQKGVLTEDDLEFLIELMDSEGLAWNDEEIPDNLRPLLVSPQWIATMGRRWGVGSQLWDAKVRGMFPKEGGNGVIPLGWVMAAVQRWKDWDEAGRPRDWSSRKVIGVDVAGEGADKTVFAVRHGRILEDFQEYSGLDGIQIAQKLKAEGKVEHGRSDPAGTIYCIDANGIGGPIVAALRHGGVEGVISFVGSARDEWRTTIDGEHDFRNNRSAAYWNLREMLDPQNEYRYGQLMLPDNEEMIADLTCPTWGVQLANPRIFVEPKDEVKKRLGRSPDFGDAVAYAFWNEAGPLDRSTQESIPWEATTVTPDEADLLDDLDGAIPWG